MSVTFVKVTSVAGLLFILVTIFGCISNAELTTNGSPVPVKGSNTRNRNLLRLHFGPPLLKVFQEENGDIKVNYSFVNASEHLKFIQSNEFEISIIADFPEIADVNENETRLLLNDHVGRSFDEILDSQFDQNVSFPVTGVRLGYGTFSFHLVNVRPMTLTKDSISSHHMNESSETNKYWVLNTTEQDNEVNMTGLMRDTYRVGVMRKETALDFIFMAIVLTLVTLTTISMGCAVDLAVVRDVLKKPIAPAIGFCSQFIIMPLLAFALCQIAGFRGNSGLGFFASGCAPGGGSSNKYTYLVDGDVSLSVTMTLISTIASMGMIPLWLFTLGQTFKDEASTDAHIVIPFENILISLVSIIITVGIGVFFKYKIPKLAQFLLKIIRPMLIVVIIFMFSFGLWANWYIFSLFTPALIAAGVALPWVGFILGGLVAFLCRQSWARVKTIAIETGIQNTGVPIMLLKFSLPSPDADIAMVAIIAANIFTSIPLWFVVAYLEIKKRCGKKDLTDEEKKNNNKDLAENEAELDNLNEEHKEVLDRESTI